MKTKFFLQAMLLSALSFGVSAAGAPLNEDFTNVIALSNSAIEAGKQSDKDGFVDKTNIAMEALKQQSFKGTSIRLERASGKLKVASKAAKSGNFPEGIAALEQGITEMQKK